MATDMELTRLDRQTPAPGAMGKKILELAKHAGFLYERSRRAASTVRNSALELARSIVELFILLTVHHSTCSSVATKQPAWAAQLRY
jgi:hypothetical protein